MITKLSTFMGRSTFRTWLYRIVVNHALNMKRGRADQAGWTFARYSDALDATPDLDLPDPRSVPADVQLLVEEARIGCTSGMLLCFDREPASHLSFDGGPKADVRWNTTEVYSRVQDQWRIVHSHWSYTKPQLKQTAP